MTAYLSSTTTLIFIGRCLVVAVTLAANIRLRWREGGSTGVLRVTPGNSPGFKSEAQKVGEATNGLTWSTQPLQELPSFILLFLPVEGSIASLRK
ncbi:hypothetical protein BX600DRAFT_55276 [Xylariales sp. PMI_506]|nr:hypothetical protein BX600DRAFT_55276 [Xylariales sp. PMI_506]